MAILNLEKQLELPIESKDYTLAKIYLKSHDLMRNIDGLQPQEAFDELLKYIFFKQTIDELQCTTKEIPIDIASNQEEIGKKLRKLFSKYVNSSSQYIKDFWKDKEFHISDYTLGYLHNIFNEISFSNISIDIRSAALKEFLSSDIRKGLGIFLTPDDVVRMMVEFVNPQKNQTVYDIACGTGTFLIETIKYLSGKYKNDDFTVYGTDKNPRMLLLAELNLGHFAGIKFEKLLIDALFPNGHKNCNWFKKNYFDIILTNPPFGMILDNISFDLRNYNTCSSSTGYLLNRQQSEVVFVEQCLNLLKPGGTLGIVLPKSVITNSSLSFARSNLDKLGYIYATALLPPETFSMTGTQTSTIVLFVKKYKSKSNKKENISIALADVNNVGYDSTGRYKDGNQLLGLAKDLKKTIKEQCEVNACKPLPPVSINETFTQIGNLISRSNGSAYNISTSKSKRLKDFVESIRTGRTPPRSSYTEEGLFLVKVGNLTGNGINWISRDRNYVSLEEKEKRVKNSYLMLKEGDILLTAAAHSPIYIAKKVDIIYKIPEWVGGLASFVGEVAMIRPNKKIIDPYILLAFLRMPSTMDMIQNFIRGQTAHLYSTDLHELLVPTNILKDSTILDVAKMLKTESELNLKMNDIAYKQQMSLSLVNFK